MIAWHFGWDDVDAYLESRPARVVEEQRYYLQRYPYGPPHEDLQASYIATMARAAFSTAELPTPQQVFVSMRPEATDIRPQTVEEQQALARAWTVANGGKIVEA